MSSFQWRAAAPAVPAESRAAELALLSPTERQRHSGLAPAAADSFLVGRMLLRELAAALTGEQPERLVIAATCADCGGPHGMPRLEGSTLRLSLSRCDLAVVAVAAWGSVGVDVEPVAGTASRLDAIEKLTGQRSLRHWTRAEAVLKADGRGLRIDPAQVLIAESTGQLRGSVAGSLESYRIVEPAIDPRLRVAVAVAG